MSTDTMNPVYDKDGIRLYCGDNCETMLRMEPASVDLVVTSPPYDDLRTYGGHSWDFYGVAWNLKRLLKPGGVIVWVVADATKDGSETGTSADQAKQFRRLGLRQHDTMIYCKGGQPPLNHRRYEQAWEFAFVFSNGSPATWNPIMEKSIHAGEKDCGTRRNNSSDCLEPTHGKGRVYSEKKVIGNVWTYDIGFNKTSTDHVAFKHPAIFPEDLARDHILSWSNEGDIVLDPFSGSGTTMKMARETGRRGIGIEINPEYIPIQIKRLEQRILFGLDR